MANFYTYTLKGGQPTQVAVTGRLIVVDSIGAANGVDITPMLNNSTGRTMPGRRKGFKCWVDFDGLVLQSDLDTTVSLFLSTNDVSLGFTEGAQVNVAGGVQITNGAGNRVPVDIAGANVQVTATNVGISNTDANPVPVRPAALTTFVHAAPVVVNTGAAQQISNDNTLRRLRVRNASATQSVAIGGAGVTLANAAIVLAPGDMWAEDEAAGATWYATSDAAGADVRVMGVK